MSPDGEFYSGTTAARANLSNGVGEPPVVVTTQFALVSVARPATATVVAVGRESRAHASWARGSGGLALWLVVASWCPIVRPWPSRRGGESSKAHALQMAAGMVRGRERLVTVFLCGDVMTGRGIDQILPHPAAVDRGRAPGAPRPLSRPWSPSPERGGWMSIVDTAQRVVTMLEQSQWIPQLLVRLYVGYFFSETGWAKAQSLDAMTERFIGWGIPFPAFSVVLSVFTELAGGALLVLGLGTRLVTIPLLINMLVALFTVNIRNVTTFDEFFELDTPLYALFFLWLLFSGAGRVSLDHLLWKRWRRAEAV